MGCNCGKNKRKKQFEAFSKEKENKLSVRKSWADLTKEVRKQLTLIQSFGVSMASRGIRNKKIDVPTKQLRVLSCFGNESVGGELVACPHLMESETEKRHYCGKCGCGDRVGTHLVADGQKYSKLDYPVLSCPLKMPGFTNYEPSQEVEQLPPMSRKAYIDTQINPVDIQKLSVTVPEMDDDSAKEIEEHLEN